MLMTSEMFHDIENKFPGDHNKTWVRYNFYFKTKEELLSLKAFLLILDIEVTSEGNAGLMTYPHYLTVFRYDDYYYNS